MTIRLRIKRERNEKKERKKLLVLRSTASLGLDLV